MSFSKKVRDELISHYSKAEHARRAELSAIVLFGSRGLSRDKESGKYIYTDPRAAEGEEPEKKVFTLDGELSLAGPVSGLTKKAEDKRAFLMGAFLAAGTISDPGKDYHFEITAPDEVSAMLLQNLFSDFDVDAKIMTRRQKWVVYVKDGEMIATALNIIGAHASLMEFENARIEHEIRGAVNRKFNCDTANINKALTASMKQIEDIELIEKNIGFDQIDQGLADICRVRLANPDATLEEIGLACTPPVGKSGANHRFRKIAQMAAKIRG